MLDRLAPLAHLLRMLVEPALHRLENVLVLPSGDPPLLAGGAAMLDGAALAGEKYNWQYQNQNVKFEVWDVNELKDQFVEVQSVEEEYPSDVDFILADDHYLSPD